MQIEILKENLQRAVLLASRFTARKAQLPVLSQVNIVASDDGIFFVAADLQKGVRIQVGGKVLEKGELAVPGKLLSDLVRSLPMGVVQLSTNEEMALLVRLAKVRAKLQGMSAETMPPVGELGDDIVELAHLDKEMLAQFMGRVGISVSKDISRPALTGVFWDMASGKLVSTDGFRLGVVQHKQLKTGVLPDLDSLLIPGDVLLELVKVMDEFSLESVAMLFSPSSQELLFSQEEVMMVGRVLQEEYPRYSAILPKDYVFEFSLDRDELLSAVRLVSIFAQDAARMIRFSYEDEVLSVRANAPQVGENRVEVEVETSSAGEIEIAFNAGYVVDILQQLESDRIQIKLAGALRPALFVDAEDSSFQHVIMPVRIKNAD